MAQNMKFPNLFNKKNSNQNAQNQQQIQQQIQQQNAPTVIPPSHYKTITQKMQQIFTYLIYIACMSVVAYVFYLYILMINVEETFVPYFIPVKI